MRRATRRSILKSHTGYYLESRIELARVVSTMIEIMMELRGLLGIRNRRVKRMCVLTMLNDIERREYGALSLARALGS